MTDPTHPAAAFNSALKVGQMVEARLQLNWRTAVNFRARVIKLMPMTARVQSLEKVRGWEAGHVFAVPRWGAMRWSNSNRLLPLSSSGGPTLVDRSAAMTMFDKDHL